MLSFVRFCLLLLLASPLWAQAVCPAQTMTVQSGGSASLDVFNCSPFGFTQLVVAPTHGTLPGMDANGQGNSLITYVSSDDGATSDTFTLRNDDNSGNFVVSVTITPSTSPLNMSPSTMPSPTLGIFFSQQVSTSGGVAPYSYVLASGTLPSGITVSSSGLISGTPTDAGLFNFSVKVTDSNGTQNTRTKAYSMTVPIATVTLNPASVPNGMVTQSYSQQLVATGGTAPYNYAQTSAAGTMPPGLTLSSSGLLSGTPTTAGTYALTLRVGDSTGGTGAGSGPFGLSKTYNIVIDPLPPLPVTSAASSTVAYNSSNTGLQLALSGGTALSLAVASNPAHGTAVVSGMGINYTPTTGYAGSDTLSYTATNQRGTSSPATLSITVSAPTLSMTPASGALNGTAATAYTQTFAASGGSASFTYVQSGTLPTGVTFDASTAKLSGTPRQAGSFPITVTATDHSTGIGPFSVTGSYTLTIAAPTLALTPATLTALERGVAYSQQMNATGGITPYTWAVTSGTLPAGLTLTTGGLLAGTPTTAGAVNFTITATDSSVAPGFSVAQPYSLTVGQGAPVAAASASAIAYGSSANLISLSLSGGTPTTLTLVSAAAHGTATVSGTSISYTPTAGYAGPDSFTYNAGNLIGTSATVTVSISVASPTLGMTPTFLAQQPQRNAAYSQQMTVTGGMAPYTYAITSGALPSGLTLSSAGLLSGTPTTAGGYSFTVTGTDSSTPTQFTAVRTYSGTVGAGAPVAAASSNTVAYGSTGTVLNLALSGGAVTTLTIIGNPAHGTATVIGSSIFYTPIVGYAGADAFTYNGANGAGTSATVTVSMTVSPPTLTLTPSSLLQPQLNVLYNQQLTAAGGAAPYTYAVTVGTLPAGMTLSSAGVLAGTPTVAGAYNFTVTATDSSTASHFSVTQAYSGTVGAGAPVAAASSATVLFGSSANNLSLALSGGAPSSLALVGSPAHGTAVVSGGSIAYTPTAGYAGPDAFTYNATNAVGTSATVTVSITVSPPTLTMTPATLPQPERGVAYTQQFSAAGGLAPYTYALGSGALPAGLGLSGSGALSGTPTTAGAYSFTITATDNSLSPGFSVSLPYSGNVGGGAPIASASSASVAYSSTANSISLQLSGGTPTSLAVIGNAAHGTVTVSGASISYTPVAGYAGPDSFTYNATNAVGVSATVTVTITVAAPTLALTPASAALSASTSSVFSQVFQASGGTAPYTYALTGTLPAGFSFSPSTGTLSGTTTQSGTYTINVRASDNSTGVGAPFSVQRSFTLTVSQPAPPVQTLTLSPSSVAQMQQGAAYSQQLAAAGGTAPYNYAVSGGALPAGVSLSTGGLLSGTPTAAGAYSFTITLSDSATPPVKVSQTYGGSIGMGAPVAAASRVTVAYGSQANAVTLSLSGGAAASVVVTAGAAHGNAVASGTAIRYTPNAGYTGADTFSYNATNTGGTSATVAVSVSVSAPALAMGSSAPWTAVQGQPYTQTITWSGGAAPYTVASVSGLPAGLSVSTTSAPGLTIAGTPTLAGRYTIVASATDSSTGVGAPFTKSQEYVLVVGAPAPTAVAHTSTASVGANADVDLMAGAQNGPFTGAAIASVNPSTAGTASIVDIGTAASPAYRLRFAAARGFSGAVQVGYTLSNAVGASPVAMVNITVAARADVVNDAQVKALASAQTQAVNRFVTAQLGNFGRRLEGLHGDGWGRSNFGLSLVPVQAPLRQQASQWQEGDIDRVLDTPLKASLRKVSWGQQGQGQEQAADGRRKKAQAAQDPNALPDLPGQAEAREALSLWVDGSLDFGQRNTRGEQQGFRFSSNGVSTGGDYRFSNSLTLGLGAGFSRANSDIGDNGSKSKATSAVLSFYGSVRPSRSTFIDGVAGYGTVDMDTVRYVGDDHSYATSTRGGKQMFVALSGGYEYRTDDLMLSPYGRVELASTTLDKTSETASGNNALTYFKQTSRVSSGVLGLRTEGKLTSRVGVWSPRVRIEYRRQFSGADEAGIAYADLAADGPTYILKSEAQAVATWTAGLGVRLLLSNGVSVLIDYNSNLNIGQGRYQSVLFGVAAPF